MPLLGGHVRVLVIIMLSADTLGPGALRTVEQLSYSENTVSRRAGCDIQLYLCALENKRHRTCLL